MAIEGTRTAKRCAHPGYRSVTHAALFAANPFSRLARGSILLVSLCFVAVLGIMLAGYLAVCSRAMNLSNRSFQTDLSKQLAEAGIDEALRAFNKNDWSDWSNPPSGMTVSSWTKSAATNVKRARRTIDLNSTRLGQGVTARIELRVDNYDASTLGADYNSSATYRIGDIVNSGGTWFRAVANAFSGQSPTSTGTLRYWAPEPIAWQWTPNISYAEYDLVNYNGRWYRCHTATTTFAAPTNTNYWAALPLAANAPISLSYSSSTTYNRGSIVFHNGTWYYGITDSNTGNTPPNTTWWAALPVPTANTYNSSSNYNVGDYVYYSPTSSWYRCTVAGIGGGSWTQNSAPLTSWMYRSGVTYNYNDMVYYSASSSGEWYRCKVATSSNVPTTTNDWEQVLSGSMHAWASGRRYNMDDVVYYTDSKWYRCISAHTSGSITPGNADYWTGSPLHPTVWKPNKQYVQYDTIRYKGLWYICLTGHTGPQLPNNSSSTYWAAAPRAAPTWDSSRYYERDDVVSYSGIWYRAVYSSKAQTPSSTSTYWAILTTSSASNSVYAWSPSTAYSSGAYVSYGGAWYKCISATTANAGHSPNNATYWTPSWKQSWQPNSVDTAGAPIIYAEATVTLGDRTTSKTQLRAAIARAPLFPNAVGSNSSISIGSAGTVDSYDSSVYAQTTQGTASTYTYNQTSAPFSTSPNNNVGYSAVLAANGTTSPSLTITGNATIQGFLAAKSSSSTYAPLTQYATGVNLKNSDGTVTSAISSYAGVDLTRISRSPYVPQFTTWPVSGTSNPTSELNAAFTADNFPKGLALPSATNIYIGTPGAIVPSRYYVNGDLILNGTSITTVNVMGPVVLYVNGNLQITAASTVFNIYATGSAEIHVSGALTIASASTGFSNKTSDPKQLIIICDTTANTAQIYTDTAAFYGVIYIPNTTNSNGLYFNHSTTATQFYGAISASKVTYRPNVALHYDTSLRHATFSGVDQPYTVTQWSELDTTEQATMP